MYLAAARDTAAMFFLTDALSRVREEYMERVLAGQSPGSEFWDEREKAVERALKERYYTSDVREVVTPEARQTSDEDDFDSRGQKLTEKAIWSTHERLKAIPFVGQESTARD